MKKYNIVMVGNFGMSYGQTCDENHIRDALKNLGQTVFENDTSDATLEKADFILCFKSNRVGPQTIKDIKAKTKAPVFVWSFDNMERFKWFYDVARECDVWLGEELGRREKFYKEGLPFYYFPFHADNPELFHYIEAPFEYDVVFTGTPYNDDENSKFKLLKAVDEKFNLHVFGNNPNGWKMQGFKNVHEPVFDKELSSLIGKSKIALAINNTRVEGYWSIRASQILLCGGFCLQRYSPQMEKELKDCVAYFSNEQDLLEKIEFYLSNEDERKKISDKGYMYAIKWLTSEQRCRELLILFEQYDTLVSSLRTQISNQRS